MFHLTNIDLIIVFIYVTIAFANFYLRLILWWSLNINWINAMDSTTCLELALEGERLCKGGDCRAGVAFFEAALRAGTDDLRTLSAVYSQLGNAFFYLGEYDKAMEYHKLDLTVAT